MPYPDMLHFYLHTATSAGAGGGDEDPHRNPYRLKSAHEADVPANQNPYQVEEADEAPQAKRIKSNYHAEPCPFCQRSFESSDALHEHVLCHTELSLGGMVLKLAHEAHDMSSDKSPYQGEEADEALRAKRVKSSYKPCPICQIPFKSSRALSLHMRRHTKLPKTSAAEGSCGGAIVRPIRCRDCGADFGTCREHLGLYYRKECTGAPGIPSIAMMPNIFKMIARERSELLHATIINNNNKIFSNNYNYDGVVAGMENNGGGNNSRDRLAQGFGILDLNLPPLQEEEEEDKQDIAEKD